MPSHVTTTSPNSDSSSKENQPLKRRQRVKSFIQMIIEEIFIIPIQVEDIPEEIPVIEHLANEITQEATGGSRSPSTRCLGAPIPTSVILKIGSYWKRMKIFIRLDSKVEIIPLPHSCPALTSTIYICHGSSSQAPPTSRVEDIFSNLMLDHPPFVSPFSIRRKKG